MELQGNSADRWQQISDKLAELSSDIVAEQKAVNSVRSILDELGSSLNDRQQLLEKMSNLAYKEVLREESGTLNDESTMMAPEASIQQKQPAKKPSRKTTKSTRQSVNQPVTPKSLFDTETTPNNEALTQED